MKTKIKLPPLAIPAVSRKNKQDMVCFEIDEDHLKIAHVHSTQLKREVINLVSREIRGMGDEEIVAFIVQTMTGFGLRDPRAFISVPLYQVITRSIEIPSQDPEEIREIVNLQASRHTPYARADIIIDTLNLGQVRENYTKVLLVIVPKEVVGRQIKMLEAAHLKLEKVFFPPEGICQAFSKILNAESSDTVNGVVHMDWGFTSFIVVQKNKILFVRGIAIGANHLLEEKEVYHDRFVDELQKSLESYAGDEIGPEPKTLYLTGVVAEITELDELFTETFHIPIKHQAYFNYFSISPAAKQTATASQQTSFFNLIAPLLLYDKMQIDLTSEEKKLKIQLEQRGRQMLMTGVLSLLLVTLLCASFFSKMYFKDTYLDRLAARYGPVKEDAKGLEKVFAKTQLVKDYLAVRGRSLEALTGLYDTIPDDVRVSNVKYDGGDKFTIKGTSSTMASVFTFVTNLERSNQFQTVKTKYVTNRNESGVDLADFEIACSFLGSKIK